MNTIFFFPLNAAEVFFLFHFTLAVFTFFYSCTCTLAIWSERIKVFSKRMKNKIKKLTHIFTTRHWIELCVRFFSVLGFVQLSFFIYCSYFIIRNVQFRNSSLFWFFLNKFYLFAYLLSRFFGIFLIYIYILNQK